ncbi:hypothetical protein OG203_37295 [Nocardia sp. NBC_01499]|uniref:hypothetical protein n=1 Tax=Nocardia sp. NBC_01499 TaxID=2903597 RepID=UPI00386EB1AD
MNPEQHNTDTDFDPADPSLHLEYLYGPQWRDVVQIIERAAQLTADEIETLNIAAEKGQPTGLSNPDGLAGLLSSFRKSSTETKTAQIAADTAQEFGRTRAVQLAGLIAGQAISPAIGGSVEGLHGLLQSLSSLGAMNAINRAVTAAVLGDLVGRGEFTRDVYDSLMDPWIDAIF